MKKVTNISLARIAFSIEEDAYEVLKKYLSEIEAHFADIEDGEEVLADIESGIAEKLSARLGKGANVATLEIIEEIMGEMGQVEDIVGEEETSEYEKETTKKEEASSTPKRLFRDLDNAILGGVASGIANYFSIDPVFVRLAFVITVFFNGLGVIAYLILWLIVPAAKTTAEKYQMRGETITLSKIAERVQDSVETIRAQDTSGIQSVWERIKDILNRIFTILGMVARFLIKVLRFVVGFALTAGGALAIAGVVSFIALMFFAVSPETTDPITSILLDELRGSNAGMTLLFFGFFAAVIPFVVSILAGVSLFTARNRFTTQNVLVLGIGWVVAATVTGSTFAVTLPSLNESVKAAEQVYLSEERTWREVPLEQAPEDVVVRGHVSVHVIESDETSLRILASDDTYRDVHVSKNGRTLRIDRDVHFRFCFFCDTYAPYVVELRAPNVEELWVRGDGDVLVENIRGDKFTLRLSGAFDAVADDVVVSDLYVRTSGSHKVFVTGSGDTARFRASGASDIFAGEFVVDDVTVTASGANELTIAPQQNLEAELSGSNTLRYLDSEGLFFKIEEDEDYLGDNTIRIIENNSSLQKDASSFIEEVQEAFVESLEEGVE